jgi:hypothetical protein
MTETRTGFPLVLAMIGRFLYKLLLAVAIVLVIGLIVGAILGNHPGGGATEVQIQR